MSEVHQKARAVRENPALQWVARAGHVAVGLVHLLIGVIVIATARGYAGDGSQSGALAAIAGAPAGFIALWIAAVALFGLAAWSVIDGFLTRHGDGDVKSQAKRWGKRLMQWVRAIGYLAVGFAAASAAMGARSDSDEKAQDASRDLLHVPGGPIILAIVGLIIGAVGVGFVVSAFARGFRKRLNIPRDAAGKTITMIGSIGYAAEGIALLLVGILLIVAAFTLDPSQAGGTDAALKALLHTTGGPWAVGAIGVGLIAYGIFCAARAKYARI